MQHFQLQYFNSTALLDTDLSLFFTICTVSMEEFLDAASSRLPTLRGLKFTSPNLLEFGRCVVHSRGKFQIMYGMDEVSEYGSSLVLFPVHHCISTKLICSMVFFYHPIYSMLFSTIAFVSNLSELYDKSFGAGMGIRLGSLLEAQIVMHWCVFSATHWCSCPGLHCRCGKVRKWV